MGLIVDIYRSDYDSDLNAFVGLKTVTVVNIDGPFAPTPLRPAARLKHGPLGDWIIVPDDAPTPGLLGPMFGGTLAHSSDSRFFRAVNGYYAVPIHDRYESPATYAALSS